MPTSVQTQVAFLNRAIKGADATAADFAAQVTALSANQLSGANAFDIPALSDAAFAKLVMTNMGLQPTTVSGIAALEPALTDDFATIGKGNRGFVVLQLAQILSDLASDTTSANGKIYNAAGAAWNTTVAASVATSAPGTYALTTSTTDKLTGGLADDIFNAITAALNGTLQATDVIDGGAGSDTLNVTLGANFDGFTVGTGSMSNVETVNLTNSGTVARTFAAKGVTGVTTYNLTGEVSLANLDSAATRVNLKSVATPTGTITLAHNAEAVVGTADSKTIGVEGLGSVVSTTTNRATINVDGIENLSVVSSGAATNYVTLTDNAVKTLSISGSAALNLNGLGGATITSVDGSAATGALTLDLADGASKGIKTVKTGSGNDSITVAVDDDIAVNAVVDAGAGTNKLVLKGGASNVEYVMSGVQTVDVNAITGTLNFSGAKSTTPIDTINVTTSARAVTSNFTGMGTGNVTVNVASDLNAATTTYAHNVTADQSGAGTVNVTVSSAATATKTETANDTVSLGKVTSLAVNVAKYGEYTGNVTADKATSVVATVDGLMQNTIAGAELLSATVKQTNKDVTTSSLTLSADKLTSLDLTVAGGLTITPSATALTKIQTFKLANDVAVGSNLLDLTGVNSVSIAGAATASAATLGKLGSTTQAYGLTLTATGQKAGLTVAADNATTEFIKVGADQAINIDISGTTGDRKIAHDGTNALAIAVSQNSSVDTGSITINAAGSGATGKTLYIGAETAKTVSVDLSKAIGNTTIGNISSNATGGAATVKANGLTGTLTAGTIGAKTISVDVNDVTGAVVLGTLTGDSVSVAATNAAGGVTASGGSAVLATVKNSLTYEGSSAAANAATVTVGSASTAFTAKLNGGFLQDQYSITSTQSTQTSITLTGNLGNYVTGSADSVSVTSTASTVAAGQTIDLSGLTVADGATTTIRGAFFTANTIKGTSGNDTIYGGSKADVITLGTGTDTVILNNPTDTGTVTNTKVKVGTAITAGGNVSTTALDVIYGFGANDLLKVGVNTGAITSQYAYGSAFALNSAQSKAALVTGTYDSAAGTFTFAAAGRDSLFVYDGDADTTNDLQAIVLVGYVTTSATADGTTGITGVAA